ncbi:MAG: hypothetical protein D8M59_06065 [Planctomycetes bacterium]|nr:hypothetical protein [Planctomycetota bacterium]NOG55061.1 hypothetical protein [Planctomycetota bacterium]
MFQMNPTVHTHAPTAVPISRRLAACLGIAVVMTLLMSCSGYDKAVDRPPYYSYVVEQSEIYVSGVRKPVHAMFHECRGDLIGDIAGKTGGTFITYVFEPPPWKHSQTQRLLKDAQPWQYPYISGGRGASLHSVAGWITFYRYKKDQSYLIAVDPLVIATVQNDERDPRARIFVLLVDPSSAEQADTLYVLPGDYPAYPVNENYSDYTDAVRDRTHVIPVNGMTLTQILDTPSLWQHLTE